MKRPRRLVVSEKTEQAHGISLLRVLGAQVYVLGTVRPKGDSYHGTCQSLGLPDVFCYLPARPNLPRRPLWWEVKRKGGRLRPEQAHFAQLSREANVLHVVGTFDALISVLIVEGYLSARDAVPHYRLPPVQQVGQ